MTQTSDTRAKLQQLLRELFQFDCADLDFGIYRIMNFKRAEIERFIEHDLLDAVAQELGQGAVARQTQAAGEFEEIKSEVAATFGDRALSAEGDLADTFTTTPLGQRYLEVREEAVRYGGNGDLEARIFDHLFQFFRFYYQDGDFIQKMRYSTKRAHYAIPYNGEEVYLHWANKDQYYVKTGEHFTDYTFKAAGITVHFALKAADVEQNNVKGEKRFFVPVVNETAWDAETRELALPFEYRPLTEQEQVTWGTRDQQTKIIVDALEQIPARLRKHPEVAAALAAPKPRREGDPVSHLEHHLRQYTKRNTSDFFIHKDLRGFLERELDFYLKNEVLRLDELLAGEEARAEGWLQIAGVLRRIAVKIIAFLAQIEDYQKKLFEKKKFVLSTDYCLTLDRVPEEFHPEIAANEAQVEEWRRLFRIDEIAPTLFHGGGKAKKAGKKTAKVGLDAAFLKAHPTLVLDTRFFDQGFRDRLLATFSDLDGETGGLLIHGDNFQALRLLNERYRAGVQSVYIDPPYNTSGSEILYKNQYKHSSWLALVDSRVQASLGMLAEDAIQCTTIDDAESPYLHCLLAHIFGSGSYLATVLIRSNPHGRAMPSGFSPNHEYAIFHAASAQSEVGRLPRDERRLRRYPGRDKQGIYTWTNFRTTGANSWRENRPKLFYPVYVSGDGQIVIPEFDWDTQRAKWVPRSIPDGCDAVYPVDDEGTERVWGLGWARARGEAADSLEARSASGKWQIYRRYRPHQEGAVPATWWDDAKYSATESGTSIVNDILGRSGDFSYPKSLYAVQDCLRACNLQHGSIAMDYFAGSGTTAHAVLSLNAEDGGDRRYILIEVGEYFGTVLKPRIQKIMFSREWKDGKPTAKQGYSHIFKYPRLESYEDALNNIAFSAPGGQVALSLDDYLLSYMLDFETRDSETLLNAKKLEAPFDYKLRVYADGETKEHPVDLPETFNYLKGLHVQTRRVYHDEGRRYLVYRGPNESNDVVVIWRTTEGWTQADLERDRDFILEQKLTEGAQEVFINADSLVPGARSLDPLFKSLMLGEG